MVTSGCALAIVHELHQRGERILFAPDRHLGRFPSPDQTRRRHAALGRSLHVFTTEFKAAELSALKSQSTPRPWCWCTQSHRPRSLSWPVVGSTSGMIKAVVEGQAQQYIVATDQGILHRMRQLAPGKTLIEAPTAGSSATCKSCAHCPWMAMNGLVGLKACLSFGGDAAGGAAGGVANAARANPYEVQVDPGLGVKASTCITRMLDFTAAHPDKLAKAQHGFVKNIGAA